MLTAIEASQIASAIDITCCVCLLPFIVFYLSSFFSVGCFRVKPPSRVTSQAKLNESAGEIYIPKFKEIPYTVRFAFCSLLSSELAPLFNAIEKRITDAQVNMSLCVLSVKSCFLLYFLAKLCTVGFLGVRSLVAYEIEDYSNCISKRTVQVTTWMSCLAFGGLAISSAVDQYVVIDQNLLQMGLCFPIIPASLNISVNVIDFLSSVTLLVLFIVPLREVSSSLQGSQTKFNVDLVILIRQNMVIGGVTILLAFLVSITVTVMEFDPVNGQVWAILGGAIRNIDLVCNCIMQVYATRGYWTLKPTWEKKRNDSMLLYSQSWAHISQANLAMSHGNLSSPLFLSTDSSGRNISDK
eukprot:TRINITY_DN12056_c0_g1_i1.p1 TRINITY_DN12056_c0_g1~~TRINITY_DN12056_c0_g1_i1.p1  ORF type:complete len:354 (-),score=53.23 TRINITY_DN12056_c0_g1_i1:129-1190(-)